MYISLSLGFFNDFQFGIFKSEVRGHSHACLTVHLLLHLLILWASTSRSPSGLSLSSVSSNLVHQEFLYRIKFLIKCHCGNTNIPPQMGRDCRLSGGGEQEQPRKNPADSVARTRPRLPGHRQGHRPPDYFLIKLFIPSESRGN